MQTCSDLRIFQRLVGLFGERHFQRLWLLTLQAYPWEGVMQHGRNMFAHSLTLEWDHREMWSGQGEGTGREHAIRTGSGSSSPN
jgi:hypothetical protein